MSKEQTASYKVPHVVELGEFADKLTKLAKLGNLIGSFKNLRVIKADYSKASDTFRIVYENDFWQVMDVSQILPSSFILIMGSGRDSVGVFVVPTWLIK